MSFNISNCKVRLHDILKCTVKVERLSKAQIDKIREQLCTEKKQSILARKHDHCYSIPSPNVSSDNENVSNSPSINTSLENTPSINTSVQNTPSINTSLQNSPSSSVSSLSLNTDDSFDDDCGAINGKIIAYPVQFEENVDSSDKVDNVNIVSASTNGVKQISTIGVKRSEEISQMNGNGIDADHTPVSMVASDDDEDDLRFLNGIRDHLDRTDNLDGGSKNCDENGDFWPSIKIFENVCLKYIRNECYGPYCDFSHELPAFDCVEKLLKTASPKEIQEAQNQLLLRYDILLTEYFEVFCKFYGRQVDRESLRRLISVISQKPLASSYLKEILDGFLISGMQYSTCVQQLLIETDDVLNSTEQFELMWELIIDVRNDKIDEQLTEFEKLLISNALVSASAINKILELQINGDADAIRDMTINIVKKTHLVTFLKIDQTLLKQYIWHVRPLDMIASKTIEQRAKQNGMTWD